KARRSRAASDSRTPPGTRSADASSRRTRDRPLGSSRSSSPSASGRAWGWAHGGAPAGSALRSLRRREPEQEALEQQALVRVELERLAGLPTRVDGLHARSRRQLENGLVGVEAGRGAAGGHGRGEGAGVGGASA